MLHVVTGGSVKDIIQTEINVLTAKIGSLHDLSSGPSSEDATWAEVVAKRQSFHQPHLTSHFAYYL